MGCQLVSNVTCCLRSEVRLLFLLHFQTDLAGLRKKVACPFSNKLKLTKLKISKVLLASSRKNANKILKTRKANFSGWQLSQVASTYIYSTPVAAIPTSTQKKKTGTFFDS
jgi:hypothetical protein